MSKNSDAHYEENLRLQENWKPKKSIATVINKAKNEWDILKKNPKLAKQNYVDSAVNKMLTSDFKKMFKT